MDWTASFTDLSDLDCLNFMFSQFFLFSSNSHFMRIKIKVVLHNINVTAKQNGSSHASLNISCTDNCSQILMK